MRYMTVTLLVSLCLALGFGIFCCQYTARLHDEYRQQIESVSSAIQKESWEDALNMTRALEETWEQHAKLLSLFTDHHHVDAVSLGLSQLRVSIQERERYHALLYAAEIGETLALIDSRDAFVLKNIL